MKSIKISMLEKDGEEFFSPTEIDLVEALNHLGLLSDGAQYTSLGLFRTAQNSITFQRAETYDLDESIYFTSSTVNGATITHDAAKKARVMAVTSTVGSKAVRQTRRYFRYTKGAPQYFIYTGNFNGLQDGIKKSIGYADESDGLIIRLNGLNPELVIRTSVGGSVTETVIPRADWNDKLDGTGKSGMNIDWTKQQFFQIDFVWQGTANVRFGIYHEGEIKIFHTHVTANIGERTFMASGVLPLRFEIENVSSGTGSDMNLNSYSVQTEQSGLVEGPVKTDSSGLEEISVGKAGKSLVALRCDPAIKANINPLNYQVKTPSGNATVYLQVLYNPVLSGTVTWASVPNSIMQKASGITGVTGGFKLGDGYSTVDSGSGVRSFHTDVELGRDINGNSDIILLHAQTTKSNSEVHYQMTWREDT